MILGLTFGLLAAGLSGKQTIAVSVEMGAPTVEYQTYPAGHPPKHAKGLSEGEAGICEVLISCEIGIAGETRRFSLGQATAGITALTFKVGLKNIIYVQEGYTPVIMDHEETHRQIAEYYYGMARKVASRLAEAAAVRKLPLGGKSKTQAMEQAFGQVRTELMDAFVREIHSRCEYAEDRFDAITDHGRNKITNDAAVAQALKEEEEHWAREQAASAPAAPAR
ncbi:MAG TPA: hypothetical protein VG734_15430 [Lacunisphaera sp.]|nr:hypothetical protein [Lacunisphaera sp.]